MVRITSFLLASSLLLYANVGLAEPGALDGVKIEAIETYKNPNSHLIGIGSAIYPFDPYHYAFCANAFYTYYFTRTWGWEIIHGVYAFNVRKDLLDKLAAELNKTPTEGIQKLNFLLSSNLSITLLYGKTIFLESFIRHYRAMLLIGPGVINTSKHDIAITANFGMRWEMYISDWAAWTIEVRDNLAITKEVENFLGFYLGLGLSL